MNLIYHPIEFHGYTEQNSLRYAVLRQRVECLSRDADEQDLMLFGFEHSNDCDRELHYQVPNWHEDFDAIIERFPQARIIRAIAHDPLLGFSEQMMVKRGLLEIEPYIDRQIVRYNHHVYLDRTGLPVYAQNKLSLSGEFADQDYRIMLTGADIQIGKPDPILAFAGKQE